MANVQIQSECTQEFWHEQSSRRGVPVGWKIIELAKIRLVARFAYAFHESEERCTQHIHPIQEHAKPIHGFPYDLEVIYNLKFKIDYLSIEIVCYHQLGKRWHEVLHDSGEMI